MPPRRTAGDRRGDRCRQARSILPFLFAFFVLALLNSSPAPWAEASALRLTVPRETPTRPATPQSSPTLTRSPTQPPAFTPTPAATAPPTATSAPGQPTPTPAPPAPTPVPPASPTPTVVAQEATVTVAPSPEPPATPTMTATAVAATPTEPATATPTLTPTVRPPPTDTPLPVRYCLAQAGELLSLRWPDGSVAITVPGRGITATLCVYLSTVNPANLPAPPAGYRFGATIARVRVADVEGTRIPDVTFAEPFTLTLRYNRLDATGARDEQSAVGYLGETSNGWAILESEHPAAGSVVAYPRRPGVFALLVRLPGAVAGQPNTDRSPAWLDNLILAAFVLVVAMMLFALRHQLHSR